MKKILLLVFGLSTIAQLSTAQVENVNYRLKYNAEACLFDAYMVVTEGATKRTVDRAQFNAQLTIVAPVTSNVFIKESFMPLMDNQNRSSSSPSEWSVSNEIENPYQLDGKRLISIVPELLPAAFYNDLQAGDEVRLFSFQVSPMTACASDVRLYDNQKDPSSLGKGMGGADFRNAFTIGGVDQKYVMNGETVGPDGPTITDVTFSMKGKMSLDIQTTAPASDCQKGITYNVVAPNGTSVDYITFLQTAKNDIQRGDYTVVATDGIGCTSEKTFNAYNTNLTEEENVEVVTEFVSGIYPNPAQREFSVIVEGSTGTTVVGNIIDIEGRIVNANVLNKTLQGGEETFLVETDLTPGMYSLVLTVNDAEKINHKLLIIK